MYVCMYVCMTNCPHEVHHVVDQLVTGRHGELHLQLSGPVEVVLRAVQVPHEPGRSAHMAALTQRRHLLYAHNRDRHSEAGSISTNENATTTTMTTTTNTIAPLIIPLLYLALATPP